MNDDFDPFKYISFSSCVTDDIWHPNRNSNGYEWWYFDAVSDDGDEIIVLSFIENFVSIASAFETLEHADDAERSMLGSPVVSFRYFQGGKMRFHLVKNFARDEFSASDTNPSCSFGENGFNFEITPYGKRYAIKLDLPLKKSRSLLAEFEWLSIESNLDAQTSPPQPKVHWWNLAVPRADVTGKIRIVGKRGRTRDEINFRGTGYHDHNLDDRPIQETVKIWHRGRVHFPDVTAIFYRYLENDMDEAATVLLIVNDQNLQKSTAQCSEYEPRRGIVGIKYPSRISLSTLEMGKLTVEQNSPIESSFFYARFRAEYVFTSPDGVERKGIGISEQIAPGILRHRWVGLLGGLKLQQ